MYIDYYYLIIIIIIIIIIIMIFVLLQVLLRYVSDKTELLNVLKPLCSRQKMTSHKSQNWWATKLLH